MPGSSIIRYAGIRHLGVIGETPAHKDRVLTSWVGQAVGVQPSEKGGVSLVTKKTKHLNRPAANKHEVTWSGQKSGPK